MTTTHNNDNAHYNCTNCDYRGDELVNDECSARCPVCNQPTLEAAPRGFVPEPIKNHPDAAGVRAALDGSRHNPKGHVVFKISDAVQIKATEPHNMGRSTKGYPPISVPDDDGPRLIVCSCGQRFDSAPNAHSHLLWHQGEVTDE